MLSPLDRGERGVKRQYLKHKSRHFPKTNKAFHLSSSQMMCDVSLIKGFQTDFQLVIIISMIILTVVVKLSGHEWEIQKT